MNSTAYRNAHGVELKPGNWFLGADEFGHKEGIIQEILGAHHKLGGVAVRYATGPGDEYPTQTILADNVFQTLGPMVIEGDGTVKQNPRKRINKSDTPPNCYFSHSDGQWRLIYQGMPLNADTPDLDRVRMAAQQFKVKPDSEFWDGDSGVWRPFPNPLTRVKVKSPAQRGGGEPSPRLTKRRKVTQKAPPGFYANPTPRLERADQPSQREHFNAKTGKMTTRPTKRLKERRALTHYADTPGVWANPAPPMKYGFDAYDADRGTYTVHDKRKGKFFETARFKDFAKAKEYAQAYADANNCQVKITGNLSHPTIKRK